MQRSEQHGAFPHLCKQQRVFHSSNVSVFWVNGKNFLHFQIDNPQDELSQVGNYSNVRIFRNDLNYFGTPLEDLISIAQNWAVPDEGRSNMMTY